MSTIQLTFPDGTVKEFPQGITALEVAKSIGPRLASDALVAKVDGRVVDLSSRIESSSPIQFVTSSSPDGLEVYRHSSAHPLAPAVLERFPDPHPCIRPPTHTRFFYVFFLENPFTHD